MSEITTTRDQIRAKQEVYLRNKLITGGMVHSEASSLAAHVIDEFRAIEEDRSLLDLLRDMVEDAGGGESGIEEVRLLMQMSYPAVHQQERGT